MRVELSPFVDPDLEAIADYIAEDSPANAVAFIRRIRKQFTLIGTQPLIYRLRPEIGPDARLASVGHYAILFHVVGDVARIERIVFGGRDLPGLYQSG